MKKSGIVKKIIVAFAAFSICFVMGCSGKEEAKDQGSMDPQIPVEDNNETVSVGTGEAAVGDGFVPGGGAVIGGTVPEGGSVTVIPPQTSISTQSTVTTGTGKAASAYEGTWVCGKATIEITYANGNYVCKVTWPNTAAEVYEWNYSCYYDNGVLIDSGKGVKSVTTYGSNGNTSTVWIAYSDGTASFTINANDRLIWSDEKESAGYGMEFERVRNAQTTQTSGGALYEGTWACGRATIEIKPEGDHYLCTVTWADSAAEVSEWKYICRYENGSLTDNGNASKKVLTYGTDGSVVSSYTDYENGSGRFDINAAGRLLWTDNVEYAGYDMEFDKVGKAGEPAVSSEAAKLAYGFYRTIANIPGGSGVFSQNTARAAYEVYYFAYVTDYSGMNSESLRGDMNTAWNSLTAAERNAFNANYQDVADLIDYCLADWDGNSSYFREVGYEKNMGTLIRDAGAMRSWSALTTAALTRGDQ